MTVNIEVGYIFEGHFGCNDILMLGKSPIKWRQRPHMNTAVEKDVNHRFKQTNKKFLNLMISREHAHRRIFSIYSKVLRSKSYSFGNEVGFLYPC